MEIITKITRSKTFDKQLDRIPEYLQKKFQFWVFLIETKGIPEVQKIPGFHDEPLIGERKGQRSARNYPRIFETGPSTCCQPGGAGRLAGHRSRQLALDGRFPDPSNHPAQEARGAGTTDRPRQDKRRHRELFRMREQDRRDPVLDLRSFSAPR